MPVSEESTHKQSDTSSKPEKTLVASETAASSEKPEAASPVGRPDKGGKAGGGRKPASSTSSPAPTPTPAPTPPATTPTKPSVAAADKTTKSPFTVPSHPRYVIPVLERFAQSALGHGLMGEEKQRSGGETAAAAPPRSRGESGEGKVTVGEKEASSSGSESMVRKARMHAR